MTRTDRGLEVEARGWLFEQVVHECYKAVISVKDVPKVLID